MLKLLSLVPSLTILAAAATIHVDFSPNVSKNLARRDGPCISSSYLCCNSVQPASSPAASALLTLVGMTVTPGTTPIGITCSPITVIGAGGSSCAQQAVCCDLNAFGGLFAVNCVPARLSI